MLSTGPCFVDGTHELYNNKNTQNNFVTYYNSPEIRQLLSKIIPFLRKKTNQCDEIISQALYFIKTFIVSGLLLY